MASPERRLFVLYLILTLAALTILYVTYLLTPTQYRPSLSAIAASYTNLNHYQTGPQPTWLIATISAASSQRRRNIIRATMHKAYTNPLVAFRFVVSNPTEIWMPLIQHENNTYGDIIMLSHLEESRHVANTVKFVEFLTYATAISPQASLLPPLPPWKYVSKVDDDSFVAVPPFYEKYLAPVEEVREHADADADADDSTATEQEDLLIGRKLQGHRPYAYPGGQFYTLSRRTALTVATQYSAHPITDEDEDVLIGRLLHEAGIEVALTELPNPVAFDFDNGVADEWAWSHNISGPVALNPHKMKEDEVYLQVARQMLELHPGWDHWSR